jgi:hypothetical protein
MRAPAALLLPACILGLVACSPDKPAQTAPRSDGDPPGSMLDGDSIALLVDGRISGDGVRDLRAADLPTDRDAGGSYGGNSGNNDVNRDAGPAVPDAARDSRANRPDNPRADPVTSDATVVPATGGKSAAQACAAEPLPTTGTVHYVCDCQTGASANCVPGDDKNDGTSPATPLRSFSKAGSTFGKMPAGDTVALCRGGLWIGGAVTIANPNCRKDASCDLRDYAAPWGDGSEPRPILTIDGGSSGRTMISFTHTPSHQEGFRILNLDLRGGLNDTAIFFWNETTDVDLCNLSMDGFATSINMSGGDQPDYGTPANIVLRGSRITNNSDIGYIAVCDNCAIEECYFDNNGARSTTTHSVYFASQEWSSDGQIVVHETVGMRLSRSEIHHSAIQCKGAPVVVHGRHRDVVIENNLVDSSSATDTCWGPGVGCGAYPYGCWFRNTIIRGNTIKGLGNAGMENDNCTGCLFENNLIIMNRAGNGITLGGQTPRPSGDSGYSRNDGQLDDPTDKAVVRNNTIYFTGDAASGRGISVASGVGHTLENNAIYFAAAKAGASDNLCYGLPSGATTAIAAVDYNVCLIPSGAHWTSSRGSGAMSLQDWQGQSGMDQHSLMADPMFAGAPDDFTPASGSPLVNAGNPAQSSAVDLNGKARDSKPDIGAIER